MSKPAPLTLVKRIPFTEWANLHANLIWIYDGAIEARWRHGIGAATHLTAWLVRKGQVKVKFGDQTLIARTGQWLFVPLHNELWREFTDDARILSVSFRALWPTGEQLFREGLGFVCRAAAHPDLEATATPLARFAATNFPKGYRYLMDEPATLEQHLQLQILFARWLQAAVQAITRAGLDPSHMGRIDTRVLKAVRLIERNALSAAIPETVLARETGMSISQLNRLFQRQFGVSPRGYCDRRRHEHAVAALESSAQTVKEIAFRLGFSSLPHFSGWFRRHHGVSPRVFRQKADAAARKT